MKYNWFKWGAEYKVHTKLLTEFETLGVMGENCSGIIQGEHVTCTVHTMVGHRSPILLNQIAICRGEIDTNLGIFVDV